MQKVRIAVIIPNFNDSHHFARCLDSILNQEVLPDEVVVVDDCSTDDSVEIIRDLLRGRENVKFLESPENLGVYGALEFGARHTSSEYLMFVAANDFVLPGVFMHAKRCLAKYPGVGLWSAMGWRVDEQDKPIGALALAVPAFQDRYFSPTESLELANNLGNWFAGPSVVYHRATYDSVGRFNPLLRGLADLVCALMVAGKMGAVFTPVPYVVFRQHSGSYLAGTMSNPEVLLPLLTNLIEFGCLKAPELFDSEFSERTVCRFVFSAIRASKGKLMRVYTPAIDRNSKRYLLETVDSLLSERLFKVRVALAFLILRPFDLWPSIWNRFLGTQYIAFKFHKSVNNALG